MLRPSTQPMEPQMHRQHYKPPKELSPRTERALSVALAVFIGAALAECLAQWAMGVGVL
jgi:hypothetical protein